MNRHRTKWKDSNIDARHLLTWEEVVFMVKNIPYIFEDKKDIPFFFPVNETISRPYSYQEIADEYNIKLNYI